LIGDVPSQHRDETLDEATRWAEICFAAGQTRLGTQFMKIKDITN